ncbi:MAG TPA: type II toxin-antitoxin system PemK/MazF family toxin [Solirubrobacteraceae bacterium]|nr:type II toxin-antitoxin system PemK/MazF family toxin [Solirubrobacteraceae bacterium]
MNRCDVVDVDLPEIGRRPAVIVTRQVAIQFLANVTVASITGQIRGLPTEVRLDPAQGLDHESVVNCDNLFTVPKTAIGRIRGELGPAQRHQLDAALAIALGLD